MHHVTIAFQMVPHTHAFRRARHPASIAAAVSNAGNTRPSSLLLFFESVRNISDEACHQLERRHETSLAAQSSLARDVLEPSRAAHNFPVTGEGEYTRLEIPTDERHITPEDLGAICSGHDKLALHVGARGIRAAVQDLRTPRQSRPCAPPSLCPPR